MGDGSNSLPPVSSVAFPLVSSVHSVLDVASVTVDPELVGVLLNVRPVNAAFTK